MGTTKTTTTMTKTTATKEQRLDLAKRQAGWDREYADNRLRELLKAAVERTRMFLDDTTREAESVLARHENREEKPFTKTSDRAGAMIDDLRNFLGNQLDLLRRLESAARDVERADQVIAVFTTLESE